MAKARKKKVETAAEQVKPPAAAPATSVDNSADFPAAVLCRLLDITERRFTQLAALGVIPKSAKGQYPLAGTVRGYIKFLKKTGGTSDIPPEELDPFQRKAHYAAALGKLSLQRESGELVAAVQMEEEMALAFKVMARFLDTLPDILERDCGLAPLLVAMVQKRIDGARNELYLALVNRDGSGNSGTAQASA